MISTPFVRAVLGADIAFSFLRTPLALFGVYSWCQRDGPALHLALAVATFAFWCVAVLVSVPGDVLALLGKPPGRALCWASAALSAVSILLVVAQLPIVFELARQIGRPPLLTAFGQGIALGARTGFVVLYVVALSQGGARRRA